jgi:hypothetical protein
MSSSLNVNGRNYMLVNDIATLAHAIALNSSGLFARGSSGAERG